MYYEYKYDDVDRAKKIEDDNGYVSVKTLKKYVPLVAHTTFDQEDWNDWFVYEKWSTEPKDCESIDEAYNWLCENINESNYCRIHDC